MNYSEPRRLRYIRRSMHKSFIQKNHLMKIVDSKEFQSYSEPVKTLIHDKIKSIRQHIRGLRISESLEMSRQFYDGIPLNQQQTAYPTKTHRLTSV